MIETEREEQPVRVQIVVAACYACEESRTIALEMRETFPVLRVDLIGLDGKATSLGNPHREDLIKTMSELQVLTAQPSRQSGGEGACPARPGYG